MSEDTTPPDLVSGFNALIGLEFAESSGERVVARWTMRPELAQPFGIQHGGVYCSVVETTASVGGALAVGDRGHVVGVSNTTNFLRAAREGTFTAVATPVHTGRTQHLWQVDVTDEAGRLIATGQVRLAVIADTAHLGRARG